MNGGVKGRDALEVELLGRVRGLTLEGDLHAIEDRKACDSLELPLKVDKSIWTRLDPDAVADAIVMHRDHRDGRF